MGQLGSWSTVVALHLSTSPLASLTQWPSCALNHAETARTSATSGYATRRGTPATCLQAYQTAMQRVSMLARGLASAAHDRSSKAVCGTIRVRDASESPCLKTMIRSRSSSGK